MPDLTLTEAHCLRVAARLCPREREILILMAAGLITKEIADRLEISISTVKVHRERIYSKLHVKGLAQAVHIATTAKVV